MSNAHGPGLETPQSFAARLGLPIKDMRLLARALTHRSFLNEHAEALEDNERLEFLGDAVLDFVVGAWLYRYFPYMSEGEMTRRRAALVSTEQLGQFGAEVGIGRALRIGHGEEEGGGRTRQAMLCNAFEALIGALYLDGGIESVRDFVHPMLEVAEEKISRLGDRDPKSMLQEAVQAEGNSAPFYKIVEETGPDHSKHFVVEVLVEGRSIGRGEGSSKQAASKEAAREALQKMERM
ncbi:MAG: ribonuclease III [Anaerolineales bacterium]|nr:ribonuclease III [Anaerolineales bacterium]MCW5856256.1 ribonuclease III [Anaerolineales bacterium]